jgi:membrane protein YdbS with pleckstrin-like domain
MYGGAIMKKEFSADNDLKKVLRAYLLIVILFGFLWWMIPIVAVAFWTDIPVGIAVALSSFVPLAIAVAVVLYWIPKFYSSIKYALDDDDITVTRGVWWTTKSVVPYNRITNINIYQGPISRRFGLAKLAIQTAGFSGVSSSGHKTAEAELTGIRNFEEMKDVIIGLARGMKPQAVEAEAEPPRYLNEQILEELRKIRKAVEK